MAAIDEYMNAQKLGLAKLPMNPNLEDGKSYLPVLDDILKNVDTDREEKLGLQDIPLDEVVGTKTRGRTTAFSSNFMPLLDYSTEFGMKWVDLCQAHLDEGIRDPIIAYEYLNHYYVQEGNKRVSVLKYFHATSIPAYVTRIVPKLTEDPQIQLYYEYMAFQKATTINYIHFSKKGEYAKLLQLVGKTPEEAWTDDELTDFKAAFQRFSTAYTAKKKTEKLQMLTVSDAFLAFLEIYGYEDILDKLPNDIKEDLPKIWEEFLMLNNNNEDDTVELKMDPTESTEQKSATLISNIGSILSIPITPKKKKLAFLYDKTPETSSWTYSHELGRLHVAEVFKDELETTAVNEVTLENAESIITKLIEDGYTTIFTTTPNLVGPSLKMAVEHPDIKFLNCSVNMSHRYIRTYYARMYEAKFILGAIAGALTDTDHIGYIASYPIYGMAASINAFALGAKMTNPRAKVHLAWSCLKDTDIYQNFRDKNISHISEQDMITPESHSKAYGLIRFLEDGEVKNIATTIWDWGQMYEKIIQSILNGGWKKEDNSSDESKALNYWWGMSAGATDVLISRELPPDTRRLVNLLKNAICKGEFNPFAGVLIDQNGEVVSDSDDSILSPEEIIKMNWLNENVIGSIPKKEELLDSTLKLIELMGIIEQ